MSEAIGAAFVWVAALCMVIFVLHMVDLRRMEREIKEEWKRQERIRQREREP